KDGAAVASGSYDQTVRLWDGAASREADVLRGHKDWVTSVAFGARDKIVASGGRDGAINVWETASGRLLGTLKGDGAVSSVVFGGKEGLRLAAGFLRDKDDGEIKIWDLVLGKDPKS